jgi:hypothetical protein
MTTKEILERLSQEFPDLLTADGYDDAILGVAGGWFDHSQQEVVAYDYLKCVELLMEDSDMSEEDAQEWMSYNVMGAYLGEGTPVFIHNWRRTKR